MRTVYKLTQGGYYASSPPGTLKSTGESQPDATPRESHGTNRGEGLHATAGGYTASRSCNQDEGFLGRQRHCMLNMLFLPQGNWRKSNYSVNNSRQDKAYITAYNHS